MFGQNAIRKREEHDGATLQVQNVWTTIQGEGPFAGQTAVFVRLTGCNVACWFCDTKWDDINDPVQHVATIIDRILKAAPDHCKLIVLTGGEPTRQPLVAFFKELHLRTPGRFTVQFETNGTFWQPFFDELEPSELFIVCSPKTPRINQEMIHRVNAWKYVLRAGEINAADGLPCASTQFEGKLALLQRPGFAPGGYVADVYISPCDEYDEEKNKANLHAVRDVGLKYGYIISLQQHKYLEAE